MYDRNFAHACREPQAEPVLDATQANFCEYFVVADAPPAPAVAATSISTRDALACLFKQR